MKKASIIIASIMMACASSFAQESMFKLPSEQQATQNSNIFNHLDISITTGTTGIGFDLAMPIGNMVQVRAGATFMPHIEKTMSFGVEVGGNKEFDAYLQKHPDYTGSFSDWSKDSFNKLSELLNGFMGLEVDENIDMIGEPSLNQAKLLVDVFPFKNKHWHVTAGFYIGDHRIAKAYNSTYDAPSLVSVSTYNSMYYKALAEEPLISYGDISIFNEQINSKLLGYGLMNIRVGDFKHDVYASEDIYYDHSEVDPIFGEPVIDENGREIKKGSLQYAKGEKIYNAGDPYRMIPDENCMVKANAYVNTFRPYLGFGYGGYIDKKYKRTQLSFDAGMMFWGGVPKVITHEGVDLMNDLTNVRASVKKYLDIMKCFPVYPVIEIRLSQRLF